MSSASDVYALLSGANTEGVDEFFLLFAYEGFNPEMVHRHFAAIKADKNIGDIEFLGDMRALITLGAMKGNYTSKNAGKISEAGRNKADQLYAKYSMKKGPLGGDKKAVILPRVLSAFPELTSKVIMKAPPRDFGTLTSFLPKIMKNPVFPSLVPKRLPDSCVQTLLYLYTVYSAEQSTVISQVKDLEAAFNNQKQFVTIAFNSSVPTEDVRALIFKTQIEELVQAVSDGKKVTLGQEPSNRADAKQLRTAINALSGF